MAITDDRNDPRLEKYRKKGHDDAPVAQQDAYLVLPEGDRARGFLRPLRTSYRHKTCGSITTMGRALSETYARDPWFYGGTYCVSCMMHRPLEEFTWEPDGESLDPSLWPEETVAAVVKRRKELE